MIRLIALAVAGYAAYRYLVRERRAEDPVALLPKPEATPAERRSTPA